MIKLKYFYLFCLSLLLFGCQNNWSYVGKNSDKNWGLIKEEYKLCKSGFNQSPINVNQAFVKHELTSYFSSNASYEIVKKEYLSRLEFYSRDYLTRGKKKFFIRYLEFHHPSEHLVNDQQSSLEMQVAFKSDDEQWLILSYFIEISKLENKDLESLIESLKHKKSENKINLKNLLNLDDLAFFYDGSFTTPPCAEGVKWYIMKTEIKASKQQLNDIIKLAILKSPNARTVQEFHPEKY